MRIDFLIKPPLFILGLLLYSLMPIELGLFRVTLCFPKVFFLLGTAVGNPICARVSLFGCAFFLFAH